MLEKADLIAKIIANEDSYDPVLMDQAKEYLAMRRIEFDSEPQRDEDKRRKPQYDINLRIEGSTKDAVITVAKSAFGDKLKSVELVEYGYSRAVDLERAEDRVKEAAEIVGELKGDLEDWKENMPENFQGGGNPLRSASPAADLGRSASPREPSALGHGLNAATTMLRDWTISL